MRAWIIYRFEKNGDNPHIHVIGVVTTEEDRKEALRRIKGTWSVQVNNLSWKVKS